MENREKKVLVIGVIGADVHAVGNKILYHAFTEAGFEVVNLGVMVAQEEYIAAAIEVNADAIVVSSLYGQGELDCRGMREKCDEAGLAGIPLAGTATLYYLKSYALMFVAGSLLATPVVKNLLKKVNSTEIGGKVIAIAKPIGFAAVLIMVTGYLADGSFNPFLYFRF